MKKQFQEQLRRQQVLETFWAQAQEALLAAAGIAARDYLRLERGFHLDNLERLPFGYYTDLDDVNARLAAAGLTAEEIECSGVTADARWSGRLVGAVRDPWGRLATFYARDLGATAADMARYLFLRGGRKPVAFGLDVALRADAGGKENLLIVEGLFDVVSLQARGFLNVAGLGGHGRHLTAKRWGALAALGIRRITLVLDNDKGGRAGTLAALKNCSRAEAAPDVFVVEPSHLGRYKDPDQFVRSRGVSAFWDLVEKRRVRPLCYKRRLVSKTLNVIQAWLPRSYGR